MASFRIPRLRQRLPDAAAPWEEHVSQLGPGALPVVGSLILGSSRAGYRERGVGRLVLAPFGLFHIASGSECKELCEEAHGPLKTCCANLGPEILPGVQSDCARSLGYQATPNSQAFFRATIFPGPGSSLLLLARQASLSRSAGSRAALLGAVQTCS